MDRGRDRAGAVAAVIGMLLGVPALGLTLARLSGSTVGFAVRIEAFAPLAVPAYAAAALLLGGWLWTRAGRRRWPAVATALALAGLVLHLCWVGPLFLGSPPPPAAGAAHLTVMSSNVRLGSADAADVVAAVERDGVEVLVLEEVTPAFVERLTVAGVDALLPHRAGAARPGAGGTMVLARPVLSGATRLPTRFASYSVRVGEGPDALTLFAVHPAPPTLVSQWLTDLERLRDAAGRDHPDLVAGDLNATLDHRPLRRLLDTGLRDSVELVGAGFRPTWPDHHLGSRLLWWPLVQIDHVLVGRRLTALTSRTVGIADTDHRAVVAEVALR